MHVKVRASKHSASSKMVRWRRCRLQVREAEPCRDPSLTGTGMDESQWQSCDRQPRLCWESRWWIPSWMRCSEMWTSTGTAL